MIRVLVTDKLSPQGMAVLAKAAEGGQLTVDERLGVPADQLKTLIRDYDGLIVRSGTQVTADIIAAGDKLRVIIQGNKTKVERRAAPAGYVYLDGSAVGDVQDAVLRDRSHLADEGVVVVTVGIDHDTGEILYGPDLDSHGLMDDPSAVLDKAAEAVRTATETHDAGRTDHAEMQKTVRQAAGKVIRAETARRPVIIPIVMEV